LLAIRFNSDATGGCLLLGMVLFCRDMVRRLTGYPSLTSAALAKATGRLWLMPPGQEDGHRGGEKHQLQKCAWKQRRDLASADSQAVSSRMNVCRKDGQQHE